MTPTSPITIISKVTDISIFDKIKQIDKNQKLVFLEKHLEGYRLHCYSNYYPQTLFWPNHNDLLDINERVLDNFTKAMFSFALIVYGKQS